VRRPGKAGRGMGAEQGQQGHSQNRHCRRILGPGTGGSTLSSSLSAAEGCVGLLSGLGTARGLSWFGFLLPAGLGTGEKESGAENGVKCWGCSLLYTERHWRGADTVSAILGSRFREASSQ